MRKLSFSRILSSFNDVIQINYLFVMELTKDQILHVIYVHYGYSETNLVINMEMYNEFKAFEEIWINSH